MVKQAQVAMHVHSVADSLHFYMNVLSFPLEDEQPAGDMALLLDSDGDPLLLIGPNATDIQSYLHEQHFMMFLDSSNRPLLFLWRNQDDLQQRLQNHAVSYSFKEERTGEVIVMLQDPNNNVLQFMLPNQRTLEEQIVLYEHVAAELEELLADLTESDVDLRMEPTSWSIRQIVHHLAYNELLFTPPLHMAINRSGERYVANWGDNEQVSGPAFTQVPISVSMNYIRATHAYVVAMLRCGPDFAAHKVLMRERPWSIMQIISANLRHLYEHLSEIRVIRSKHRLT